MTYSDTQFLRRVHSEEQNSANISESWGCGQKGEEKVNRCGKAKSIGVNYLKKDHLTFSNRE